METPFDDNAAVLQTLRLEAGRLAGLVSYSQFIMNDLTALEFLSQLHAVGHTVSVEEARGCVDRIRITVETGTYPVELLSHTARVPEAEEFSNRESSS